MRLKRERPQLRSRQRDDTNERFFYDPNGYPLRDLTKDDEYQFSFLKTVEDRLTRRDFLMGHGEGNNNTWDFMKAICQYSYLLSYEFIPEGYDHKYIYSHLGYNLKITDMQAAIGCAQLNKLENFIDR